MKRFRSSEDLDSYGEKNVVKDWVRKEDDAVPQRSSSSMHRSSYYKSSDSGRKVLSSSGSRYDRVDEDRDSSRLVRKRSAYDLDGYDRRKNYDRQRDVNERANFSSSPRPGYGTDRIHRSESFASGPRRDFPKGFRSERDRPRRENIVSSWRRFGGGKDSDDGAKSANESSRGSRMESEDTGKLKSPKGARDVKSPGCSKESGSERSKSIDGKKCDDNNTTVESFGPSSEREEGELEPDPQPSVTLAKAITIDKSEIASGSSQKDLKVTENHLEHKVLEDIATSSSVGKGDDGKEGTFQRLEESVQSKDARTDVVKADDDLQKVKDVSVEGVGKNGDEDDTNGEKEGSNNLTEGRGESALQEDEVATSDDKLPSLQEKVEEDEGGKKIETNAEDTNLTSTLEATPRNEVTLTEKATRNLIDKGKSVAVSPYNSPDHIGVKFGVESEPRDSTRCEDVEIEGPSTIGYQFFSTDLVKNQEKVEQSTSNKPKDDKLALELSLSLPSVLLPIGAQSGGQAPGSPSHGRSIQSFASSFRTTSDGFTASMSFSGSQQLTHNPSCSLNHDMYDYEKSVGSKPLFKGVDWNALSSDENKSKDEPPAYPVTSLRENGLNLQSQVSKGNTSGQIMVSCVKAAGGNSKLLPVGLEKQLSFSKQTSGSQGFVSYKNGSDKRQLIIEKDSINSQKNNYVHGIEQGVVGTDFAESIVTMIVSEPLNSMTRRFSDMNALHISRVKEFVHDIISNPSKQWQFSTLQKALQKRQDITLDMLLSANRVQLEILVALKTGVADFVLQKFEIASSDLAEMFLNMRCKNPNCRSLLPVDECDCKICARKSDFCRECMCLVCSKFDTAANTCIWVGCDVCLHWCHTDCGLRESHVRNGRSAKGGQNTTEMQFYCVACDHPSEMFGFVKEVFQNFAKDWTLEILSRELEYVRRIFCASDDVRGKRLHEIAVRMLSRLAGRVDLQEVKNHIMSFFIECDSEGPSTIVVEPRKELPSTVVIEPRKELPAKIQEGNNNGLAGSSHEWRKPIDKASHLENPINLHPKLDISIDEKYGINLDFRRASQPVFDELESIVRIKQAEAKMFQSRADDARKESEALKRISISKSVRVEEEYRSRINKLRLAEAEDMRKQKIEELQSIERSFQEYFNMKMRMETEIKDLLLKMEATRRNLAM